MILLPAIDIKNGKVVRLFQGKFSDVTEYADDPIAIASKWEYLGAKWLHLVDLDGAKTGAMVNKDAIIRIVQAVKIPVEVGGGIRDEKTVEDLIASGISRVILGTKAIENREFLKKMVSLYGQKICVSLDCSNGFVAQRGWVSTTDIKATDLAVELEALGLQWMVYTDIARDGTLSGPNFEQLQTMINTVKKINLIASGGIGKLEDVRKLSSMKGVVAAITGKAIYEGTLDFQEALKVC
ncbi:MAG: 1-(5-phosphoribosyl)-5-[(5-phosphoribosylamino)methylideneamino]imidazole-4-carboxamide isomerase [Candidatus Omnitrophota bacterium]